MTLNPQVFTDAAALCAAGWCQSVLAKSPRRADPTAQGGEVSYDSPTARFFCIEGGIFRAARNHGLTHAEGCAYTRYAADRLGVRFLQPWNDLPAVRGRKWTRKGKTVEVPAQTGRTQAEVVSALRDCAASLA